MNNWHQSQRGYFAGALYDAMEEDKSIYLVVGDLGYKVFDKHFLVFPERCINVGAAEQAGVGIAVGLALEGKKVFFYTITSFLLRAAETIGLYLHGEQIPVVLVGAGRNKDYGSDGVSHYGELAQNFLGGLEIRSIYPESLLEASHAVAKAVKSTKPLFISLKR